MTAISNMSLVLLLLITVIVKSGGEPISLSTIRYKFTTCGHGGRIGPTYEMCLGEYTNTSILANPDNFFFYNKLHSSGEYFAGGQGFRIPTTGRYNVTVAGASGGRGICNIDKGKGLLWRGELNFVAGEEVLILVGQKGRSPCESEDFVGAGTLCQNPPLNETESAVCNETWYSRLLLTVPDDRADFVYANIGGGGGGGASLIRLINHTSDGPIPAQFPLLVAPGGGGSACLAVYNVTNQIQATFPDSLTDMEQYEFFMNAKYSLYDPEDSGGLGRRGYVYEQSSFRGGAGGGYFTTRNSGDVDGGYLNAEENFAEGGFDCSRQLFDLLTYIDSTDIYGGFGGGGGQCGGGGSGGGFSGGRSTGADHSLPGQGGFYYRVGSITSDYQDKKETVETISVSLNKFDDGFVEFVLRDCGCGEMCIINEVADTFECFCPNNETVLALNGFDCAKDIVLDFNASSEAAVLIKGITFTPVYLPQAISLFAMSGAASMNDNTTSCTLVFFGADSKPALATNVLTDRTSSNLDHLSVLHSDAASTYSQSAYHKYLPRAVTVTGGVLVSEGHCQLLMEQVNLTISTQNVSSLPISAISLVQDYSDNELISLAQTVFGLDSTAASTGQDTTTATESATKMFGEFSEVVWSLIVISVLFFIVLICVTLIVIVRYTWKRSRSGKLVIELQPPPHLDASGGSMIPNAYYHAFSVPPNDPFVPNQYIRACPPKKLDQHDYEIISFSDFDDSSNKRTTTDYNAITASARNFHTKFGVTAPVHDFTSYNKHRVGDLGQLWEYPRGNLIYLRELGEGQFGKVLLMRAKGIANFQGAIPVAVKTLSFRAPNMLQKFIEETNLMKKFCHPNIVSLLGVSSHDVNEDSAPLMILEYMPYGDLHGFLKKNKPQPDNPSTITPAHFFSIGRDVAEALSFLGSQGYVHRDVAARNCLVGPDLSIKIADFGLSRAVQTKNYYRVEGKTVLPVKWMAPESLIYGIFSTASDVWSFGVLLWEVVSFGELPLDALTTEELIEMAETKTLCHQRPENCPEEIHMVMCSCHQNNPTDRIGFEEILRNFSKDNIDDYFEKTIESI